MFEQKEIPDGDAVQPDPEFHICTIPERRKKPRVDCDYQAIVEGTDRQGNAYKEDAKLVNLSAGGLYMWANCYIELGSKVYVTVFFSNNCDDNETPKLMTKGIVMRIEPQIDGTCGFAIKLSQYRFI